MHKMITKWGDILEIKKDKLQFLLNMEEKELKAKLKEVMQAMGVEEKKIEKLVTNLPKLKETVADMSDEQLSAFGAHLGEEKIKAISRAVEEAQGNKNG